jgi:hypothetical protein
MRVTPASASTFRARARSRLATRASLAVFFVALVSVPSLADAQLGDDVDVTPTDGDEGASQSVEVASYFTEFTRQGPYPYQVCEELPGEIGVTETDKTARCIPVEAGELEFCTAVSYDTCSRVVSPTLYDEQVKLAHQERIDRYSLEFPVLATTECKDAFQMYFCLLAFPRCEEDTENPGSYIELPLCYDYCVNAHTSCSGDATFGAIACDKAVALGRVAPPRPDVTCVSAAAKMAKAAANAILAATAATAVARAIR